MWSSIRTRLCFAQEQENFDIYTVFVTAYEIIIDTSPPPVNLSRHERSAWRPKHVVRIVLSSIAMAIQIPILQLKPSILNYILNLKNEKSSL
mmetsp:Transcript_22858/g.29277  ORF Transcript_22858/g.29277 Transcript_22858/m.29277 type:complete len:92 (-) Transcript_22858:1-276(-)